ncbi:hypothetical protein SERLA73DRAFT_149319 [Serpula lacrymans var. lacrymans S7.3]|uniref:Uncharacterized protein n=1 Tax=Serpula lacrymans var. lacrymans (strain S7.3) TaxID=936435 RepID=F8PHP1_SERL3|nr:hypothetical protein SERLA73DRAFT_149319 [Serpula lacrymans var. lacrymans S7.3]
MARILLGCIIGKVPSQVVTCYRALLNFIYIAQYASHDNTTIQYLEDSLDLYHANMHILVHLGVQEYLNIPKLHSMLHHAECIRNFGTNNNYNAEIFEMFHIDFAKECWRASNFRDRVPQMTQWLSRQEKVAMFESYLNNYKREEEKQAELEGGIEASSSPSSKPLSTFLAKHPHSPGQTLKSVQTSHQCPSFSCHLRTFLNKFMDRGNTIPRNQVALAQLPFDRLNIWHSFKFVLDSLGNDIDSIQNMDGIKAKPGKRGEEGRFDAVIVAHIDKAEARGLQGIKVGRLRVIFSLQDILYSYNIAPYSWPKGLLVYVEWYKISRNPGQFHNMYIVTKPVPQANGVAPGAIVLLGNICQS